MKKIIKISSFILIFLGLILASSCTSRKGEVGGGLWGSKPNDVVGPGETPKPNPDNGDNPGGIVAGFNVPTGLAIDSNGLVSWNRVEGAESYDIEINGVEITGRKLTSFSLLDMENKPSNGIFVVKVRAVKADEKTNYSESVSFTYHGSRIVYPVLSYDNQKLVWTPSSEAKETLLKIDDKEIRLPNTTGEYDLKTLTANASISLKFIGDGVYKIDSKEVKVEYEFATKKLHLPKPTNVKMDGSILSFDEVIGANIYYLQDVNNTVTQITAFESDRSNKYLIKAVWAGNTDVNIENSSAADVVYFDESKGDGSATKPYLISSSEEMRYIEFYESTNQAKHYKFAADIELEQIEFKQDEDVSNFYNLGSLSGVIDGDGHKLSNLIVYYKDGYSSIFDSIGESGVIKNLVIDNADFKTWTNRTNDGVFHEKGGECAILTYINRGTIDNVKVTNSKINAVKDGAAALVSINKGTISNCHIDSQTAIYGANEAGGIAIFNSGTIELCINEANVSGNTTIGGIVGRNNGLVNKCGNKGTVSANVYAGGIVGYNYNIFDEKLQFISTIKECYNAGEIKVASYGGGIAGKNGGDGINEVGKGSYANAGVISCRNQGTISGSDSLGGIVGDNYGYHEKATDLGVVNCFNSGKINVDSEALKSMRIFLSLENCSWGSDAGAVMYLHFWSNTESSTWPGIRMKEIVVSSRTYYYADVAVPANELKGIIFNRANPSDGSLWNQSEDIVGSFKAGELLFKINNSWTTASKTSSLTLLANVSLTCGGVVGYSNMINDCYYLAMNVNNKALAAGVASGTQYNRIYLNNVLTNSQACCVENTTGLTAKLNAVTDVWKDGSNGPILKWES